MKRHISRLTILVLFLFTQIHVWAQECQIHYFDKARFEKEFFLKFQQQNKLTPEQLEAIETLSQQNKYYVLELVKHYKTFNFTKAMEKLKKTPKYFEVNGTFSPTRFLAEIADPNYAKAAFKRAQEVKFETKKYDWLMPKFLENTEISILDKSYREAFEEVRLFLDDEAKVFMRMQELEDELIFRLRAKHPKYFFMPPGKKALARQKIMLEILGEQEMLHGFESAVQDGYSALVLENKSYSMEEWMNMLKDGKMFNDAVFKRAASADLVTEQERAGHGYFTHRVQWYILMKEMDADAGRFGNYSGVQLYKKLGSMEFNKRMGLGNNAGNTLWQRLFDAIGTGTYHSPEYFRKMHTLYPELGVWL